MLGRLALAFVCAAALVVGWPVSSPVRADDDVCPVGRDDNPQNRPDGSLIRDPATGTIYRVEGCAKRPFRTWEEFDSHRYSGWISVPDVSPEELAKLPTIVFAGAREGALFRNNTAGDPNYGTIYIIDETGPGTYTKRPITGATWNVYFVPCSYATPPNVSASWLASNYPTTGPTVNWLTTLRPDGQVVKASSSATDVFIVAGNGQKQKFSNTSDRNSYNFPQQPCIDGAIASPTAYPYGVPSTIRAREGTVVQNGSPIYAVDFTGDAYQLRSFTSMDSLTFYTRVADVKSGWSTSGYGIGPHVHPYKTLWSIVWNKSLVTNDLGTHTQYQGMATPGSWDTEIAQAKADWNAAPIAPDFFDDAVAPYDVEFVVRDFGLPWVGQAQAVPPQGPVTNFIVNLDWSDFNFGRQSVVAHELGHVLLLWHDGMNPDSNGDGIEEFDGQCGGARVPVTLEDYDCEWTFGVSSPTNWDFCGVNHKHPTGAWSGC